MRPYGPTLADAPARGSFRLKYDDSEINYPYRLYYLESTYFRETYSAPFAPTEDSRQTVAVERKQVDVNADVDPGRGHLTVIEPDGVILDQLPQNEGDLNAELPKRAGRRLIRATARGRYPDSALVAADQPAEVAFALEQKPECSDGINNDGDAYVDAEDPGCSDGSGGYDPMDDDETHDAFVRKFIRGFPDTLKVSSAQGQREVLWISNPVDFPVSITVAIGEIGAFFDNKREADQDGETFALRFETGSRPDDIANVNTSDIVRDENKQDGFESTEVHGINKSFFVDGTSHQNIYIVHSSKVRGDQPGDGNDDVILDEPPETGRVLLMGYNFEPDEVPEDGGASAVRASGAGAQRGECQETDLGTVCRDGDLAAMLHGLRR